MTKVYKADLSEKRQIATLMATVAVVGANGLLLGPVLGDVAASLDTLPASIAWAMSAYGAGTTLSALILAPQIDRFGERKTLQLSMLVLCVAFVASAAAGHILMLSIAQFCTGLAAGLVLPASYGMATQLAEPGKESGTLGRVLAGWSLSLVGGVPMAAFIADHLHWRMTYCLLTVCVFLVWLLVRRFPTTRHRHTGPQVSLRSVVSTPGVRPIIAIALVYTGSFYGVYAFIAPEIQRTLAVSTSRAGLVVLAFGLGFAVAAFAARFLDRWRTRLLFPAILLANAVVYALMPSATGSLAGMLSLAVFWGFVNHLCLNSIVLLLTRINPAARGALLGLNSATTYLGLTLGTAIASRVYPATGFSVLALSAAVMHLLAVAIFVVAWKPAGKSPEDATSRAATSG